MPFDGVNYGEMPLISHAPYQSDARATGDVLRRCLAAAYLVSRTQSTHLATVTWSQHPRQETLRYSNGSTSSMGIICEVRAFLPAHATHVFAGLSYFAREQDALSISMSVAWSGGGGDTGDTVTQRHEPIESIKDGRVLGELRHVPIGRGIIKAFVTPTTTDTHSDITVRLGCSNNEASGTPTVAVRPQILTLSWAVIG